MAMSNLMITLSFFAALTFVSDASFFAKGVIYTILCTIWRIDWSDTNTGKTTDITLIEPDTESVAIDTPTSLLLDFDSKAADNLCVGHGDAADVVDPTPGSPSILDTTPRDTASQDTASQDTASQDTKPRSRASSISSTTSLFDKPTSNDRPSTPNTEIGDIPEFSTLAAKYQGTPATVNTKCHIVPSIETSTPDIPSPVAPNEHRPPPPPPITSVTKYSMTPTELVHAVDDFSMAVPLASATSNKRKLDTLQNHDVKMAGEGDTKDVVAKATETTQEVAAAEQSTVPKKKKKLNSRQRRQRALRHAAEAVGSSSLGQVES